MRFIIALATLASLPFLAAAATEHAHGPGAHGAQAHGARTPGVPAGSAQARSPYAGEQSRAIKSLSEAEIDALATGAGAGLAKAAELNGYPGPTHVLELADRLRLDERQRDATRRLLDGHKTKARRLGAELLAAETDLDGLFARRQADAGQVEQATQRVGALQAQLRAEHLNTHLLQTKLLSDEQVRRYAVLRGYSPVAAGAKEHDHGHAPDGAVGVPGQAAKVSRTIAVDMNDKMRFVPAQIAVRQGETIRFVVRNVGRLEHEFVLGSEASLKQHEEQMKRSPGMAHEESNMVSVAPGKTGELVWRFTEAGRVAFACLEPGHYDAGMKGRVEVAARTGRPGP